MKKLLSVVFFLVLIALVYYMIRPASSVFEVQFKASEHSENLANITINLGDDKVTLTEISPNTTESVSLYPDEKVQMSLGVGVYRFPNTRESTDQFFSQELYPEFSNVRIRMIIDEQGKIQSTDFCKLPCSFD